MKKTKAIGIQYAALPYRIVDRKVEVLLITSRETRRWVIPKGWPMSGKKPQDAAATEALEEAGLLGEIAERSIGSFRYLKRLKGGRAIPVQVIVFPMKVTGRSQTFKEEGQRQQAWFRYNQAAALVAEPNLKRLIREFGLVHTRGLWPSARRLGRWLERALLEGRR